MSAKLRIELEKKIVHKLLKAVIEAGYTVAVDDGEETSEHTADIPAVMAIVFNLDDCYLRLKNGALSGWICLVFGNDGHDCINDYTTNLEELLKPVNAYADKYAA